MTEKHVTIPGMVEKLERNPSFKKLSPKEKEEVIENGKLWMFTIIQKNRTKISLKDFEMTEIHSKVLKYLFGNRYRKTINALKSINYLSVFEDYISEYKADALYHEYGNEVKTYPKEYGLGKQALNCGLDIIDFDITFFDEKTRLKLSKLGLDKPSALIRPDRAPDGTRILF